MAKRENLKTPGEMLQEARRARQLSLTAVSSITKIPEELLAAVELDEYHKLSGPLYAKSFLRTYAACVGLEPQVVLDRYHRLADTAAQQPPGEEVWQEEVQVQRIGFSLGRKGQRALVIAVVIVVLGVLIVRSLLQRQPEPGPAESAATESAERSGALAGAPEPIIVPPHRWLVADGDSLLALSPPVPEPESNRADTPARPDRADPGGEPATTDLPPAVAGDARLLFQGGQTASLVLRVISPGPLTLSVRQYGHDVAPPIRLPLSAAPPLPPRDIEYGRAYAVREGYAIYWGAGRKEAFELHLSTRTGVEVQLNGQRLDILPAVIGDWWLLDAYLLAPVQGPD